MNFEKAVRNINRSLNKKQPTSFTAQWIKNRCKASYQFIIENTKTNLDEPDWDFTVSKFEKHNQRLWMKGVARRVNEPYENDEELNVILNSCSDKLYTFLSQLNKDDKIICDWISIRLVRLAQKGNLSAKKKIVGLLEYLVNQWVENNKSLFSWRGHNELMIENIEACVRRFRYAGSFTGYLYRTLEYAGQGLAPLAKYSLDDFSMTTGKRKIDTFVN